eukprot:comp9062_c0_seq1/m.4245 comp9062_c0_seq1/g.4245  ORF comp9062_c0_seq1/g.4245 comp9062_c0_seq1/m.4245 type:complete len:158 (-) comp9062_c0_seq1:565-1038(-)
MKLFAPLVAVLSVAAAAPATKQCWERNAWENGVVSTDPRKSCTCNWGLNWVEVNDDWMCQQAPRFPCADFNAYETATYPTKLEDCKCNYGFKFDDVNNPTNCIPLDGTEKPDLNDPDYRFPCWTIRAYEKEGVRPILPTDCQCETGLKYNQVEKMCM